MFYDTYYGEISEEGKKAWTGAEMSPFHVLAKNNTIRFRGHWMDFLAWARKELRDEVQVDWGSFAWRCLGSDIRRLGSERKECEIDGYEEIDPDREYGVVFIEMS